MAKKKYTVRSAAGGHSQHNSEKFNLKFEGKKAFVIWDSVRLGDYRLEARMEIDPELLKKVEGQGSEFVYCGELVLPKPENN